MGSALAAAAHADLPAPERWVRVPASDSFFEAWLPFAPEPAQRSNLTPVGRLSSVGHRLGREADGCEIWINELPSALSWLGGESWAYNGAKSELLEEAKGRELSFGNFARNGIEGRELVWESERSIGRAEFYARSGKLYLFTCYARRSAPRALIDAFFDRLSLRAVE
jgi:hypothetical protein